MPFDSNYLGDAQVKAEIETSFSPMRCVAQFSMYHHSSVPVRSAGCVIS
jgi:hypothetical protein